MAMPKEWVGKNLIQLDIRRKYNLNVISIKRGGKVILPSPDTPMDADDVLYIIGEMKDVRKCFKI
jgi:trk system potassium uptake protein TrkA